jgi:hypothetical protein
MAKLYFVARTDIDADSGEQRVFERTHPMTVAIGTAYGWTPAQIDAFFLAASVL